MSIYKRGKSWYLDIYVSGIRTRKKLSAKKSEALEIEAELKTKYRNKKLGLDPQLSPLPFEYLAIEYLTHCKATKHKRTYEMHAMDYRKHLQPFFGLMTTEDITNDLLLQFQAKQKIKKYANRTVNIHMALIRKILNFSNDKGYCNIKLKYPMLPEGERHHAFLNPEEKQKFLSAFKDSIAYKRVVFGLMTGMRPAELTYLSWPDIDMNLKIAKITSKKGLWEIKTKEERIIPLNQVALEILRELYSHKKGTWVFSTGRKPVKSIRRAIDTARQKAGIKKKITPNMLRHTFASDLIVSGADIRTVQELLGHRHVQTTMRYLHPFSEQLRKAVDTLVTNRTQSQKSSYRPKLKQRLVG